jgi:hypothetical protein
VQDTELPIARLQIVEKFQGNETAYSDGKDRDEVVRCMGTEGFDEDFARG